MQQDETLNQRNRERTYKPKYPEMIKTSWNYMECDISISNMLLFFLFQMTSNLPQFASHSDKQKIRECPSEMLNYRRKSLETYTILETALLKGQRSIDFFLC